MTFKETYNSISDYLEADNLAEAFSLLMNYAYENNADDKTLEAVFELVGETDVKQIKETNEEIGSTKKKIIDLLNSIPVNEKNHHVEKDINIVKLKKDFLIETQSPVFSCKNVDKKLGSFSLQNISL